MTPDMPAPTPRRPEWLIALIIVGAIALVMAIGAGVWWWTTQRSITVDGDITVNGGGFTSAGSVCTTDGGYTDIKTGAQVVIKDAAGKVLATTTLGVGTGTGSAACTFPFHADVPAGSDFYGVELGRRGVVQFTAGQLAEGVHLTIGD
jgi:hypothetical protein